MFETNGTAQTSANTSSSATESEEKQSGNWVPGAYFLCDGKVEDCDKAWCFATQGPCMHTSDIRHARNFEDVSETKGLPEGSMFLEKRQDERKGFR